MPTIVRDGHTTWKLRDRAGELRRWLYWLIGASIVMLCWSVIAEHTTWMFVWDAPTQGADIVRRMSNPRWAYFEVIAEPLWDTINIATLGTLLGIAIAVPIAFLAAHNTTPSRFLVRPVALLVIVSSRSINSLIWALLLVLILGPGMLAGILAIAFRSIGFIGKLLYEAIEEIDRNQVEAVTATGASRLQVLTYGVVPQVMPTFAGISVYRWDINIREATVLGLVGAGGIGVQLQASVNTLAWNQVTVIFIAILGTVVVSEWVSARVRHAII
jgi:phosphonate transport system permease protein